MRQYYATLWSYNNRNGDVVGVAALVVVGVAEACLQRLRWWLGRSSWRHIRFSDNIAMHSYLHYTVFKDGGRGNHPGDIYVSVIMLTNILYYWFKMLLQFILHSWISTWKITYKAAFLSSARFGYQLQWDNRRLTQAIRQRDASC